ncbi:hypothetical protein OG767_21670 [Micromonospora sp. NBC_01392]|uniref:hypothetical protein n=1 Tax=Micromonospora sp. NBC_01392 TaxID=2903588 RepID=UPI00324C8C06
MPKSHSTPPGDQPPPVPVGLLLPHSRFPRAPRTGVPHWHGLSPSHLAYLICRYTHVGGVVLDLDAHPVAIAATAYLRRVPAQLITGRHGSRLRILPPDPQHGVRRAELRPGAGVDLILASLPEEAQPFTYDSAAMAMTAWRPLLRPGGFLLVGLTSGPARPGDFSHRTTVIAAARAVGLFYHQHIPAVLVPLPEHEPRTAPELPDEADEDRRLLDGRHLPAFRDLLVFGTTATGEEGTRA